MYSGEESSLSLAASRPPPPTSAGRSTLPATPLRQKQATAKAAKELRPSRPQGVSPDFRAALVQPSLRSPFPFSLRFIARVGETPPLAVATPRLRQVAFGM